MNKLFVGLCGSRSHLLFLFFGWVLDREVSGTTASSFASRTPPEQVILWYNMCQKIQSKFKIPYGNSTVIKLDKYNSMYNIVCPTILNMIFKNLNVVH